MTEYAWDKAGAVLGLVRDYVAACDALANAPATLSIREDVERALALSRQLFEAGRALARAETLPAANVLAEYHALRAEEAFRKGEDWGAADASVKVVVWLERCAESAPPEERAILTRIARELMAGAHEDGVEEPIAGFPTPDGWPLTD